jgi:hypothetical protein
MSELISLYENKGNAELPNQMYICLCTDNPLTDKTKALCLGMRAHQCSMDTFQVKK